jgi:hypothetical protein
LVLGLGFSMRRRMSSDVDRTKETKQVNGFRRNQPRPYAATVCEVPQSIDGMAIVVAVVAGSIV